jgi:hypothetical protein
LRFTSGCCLGLGLSTQSWLVFTFVAALADRHALARGMDATSLT